MSPERGARTRGVDREKDKRARTKGFRCEKGDEGANREKG